MTQGAAFSLSCSNGSKRVRSLISFLRGWKDPDLPCSPGLGLSLALAESPQYPLIESEEGQLLGKRKAQVILPEYRGHPPASMSQPPGQSQDARLTDGIFANVTATAT